MAALSPTLTTSINPYYDGRCHTSDTTATMTIERFKAAIPTNAHELPSFCATLLAERFHCTSSEIVKAPFLEELSTEISDTVCKGIQAKWAQSPSASRGSIRWTYQEYVSLTKVCILATEHLAKVSNEGYSAAIESPVSFYNAITCTVSLCMHTLCPREAIAMITLFNQKLGRLDRCDRPRESQEIRVLERADIEYTVKGKTCLIIPLGWVSIINRMAQIMDAHTNPPPSSGAPTLLPPSKPADPVEVETKPPLAAMTEPQFPRAPLFTKAASPISATGAPPILDEGVVSPTIQALKDDVRVQFRVATQKIYKAREDDVLHICLTVLQDVVTPLQKRLEGKFADVVDPEMRDMLLVIFDKSSMFIEDRFHIEAIFSTILAHLILIRDTANEVIIAALDNEKAAVIKRMDQHLANFVPVIRQLILNCTQPPPPVKGEGAFGAGRINDPISLTPDTIGTILNLNSWPGYAPEVR